MHYSIALLSFVITERRNTEKGNERLPGKIKKIRRKVSLVKETRWRKNREVCIWSYLLRRVHIQTRIFAQKSSDGKIVDILEKELKDLRRKNSFYLLMFPRIQTWPLLLKTLHEKSRYEQEEFVSPVPVSADVL